MRELQRELEEARHYAGQGITQLDAGMEAQLNEKLTAIKGRWGGGGGRAPYGWMSGWRLSSTRSSGQ